MKEGIDANWLALERHCNARIALDSPLLGYLVGHVYRMDNAYCEGKTHCMSITSQPVKDAFARMSLYRVFWTSWLLVS